MELPGWLKAILEGGYEPQADEDKLYALADQYDLCAKYLTGTLPGEIDAAASAFGSAYRGEAGIALDGFLRRYAHDKELQGPAMLADATTHLAEFLRTMGDTIVRTKRELLIIGIVSWITILAGLGPIMGTLIRKLGQEGVKRLILMLLKKLVNREAKKLQARVVAEMVASAAQQTGRFVFSREMVPRALALVGAELVDEVLPHALAGWWGKATGQDRRLVVDSHGRPVTDDDGHFVTTRDWDWRGTAMTATGAVIGVPLSHGLGVGLAKVPLLGKIGRTFVNNAITSPLASSLTAWAYGEGWHNPSLQDAWIAGAHGAVRNSTPSDIRGPLESIGGTIGEYVGNAIISAVPGGNPPSGPDGGGQVQTPPADQNAPAASGTTGTAGSTANSTASSTANSTANSTATSSVASQVAQSSVAPAVGAILTHAATAQTTSTTSTQTTRTTTTADQDHPTRRDPAKHTTPPDNPTDEEADQETHAPTTETDHQPANPQPQTGTLLDTTPTQDSPTTPAPPTQPEPTQPEPTTSDAPSTLPESTTTTEPSVPSVSNALTMPGTGSVPSGTATGELPAAASSASSAAPGRQLRQGAPALDGDVWMRPIRPLEGLAGLRRGGDHPHHPNIPERPDTPPDASPTDNPANTPATPNTTNTPDTPGTSSTPGTADIADAVDGVDVAGVAGVLGDGVLPESLREAASYRGLGEGGRRRVVEAVVRLAGGDPARLEGLRGLLESPGLLALGPAQLLAEVARWERYEQLFGRAVELGARIGGSPATRDTAQWESHSWADATDLHELQSLPEKLSTSGRRGQLVTLDEHAGVYSIQRDGTEWIVKLLPDSDDQRLKLAAEFEGVVAAARTGYGPTPYGLVRATVDGNPYVGLAMSRVPGAMVHSPHPTEPAALAEVERARRAVTFDTVLQLHEYLQRLLATGYHSHGELQPLIDPETGNLRVIDLADVQPVLDDPEYQRLARADYGFSLESDDIRSQLIEAAVENAHRAQDPGRARRQGAPANADGLSVDAVRQEVEAVRRRMRLPRGIDLQIVVGPDVEALAREYGIEGRRGPRPGYFRMEGGTGVVYLSAKDHHSAEDVAASVWHEIVGHFGWRLFSPEVRAEVLSAVHNLRELDQELSAEIDELYADQPSDVRDEEFLARLAEGGPPTRLRQSWNGLLSTRLGTAFAAIGAISNETLEKARRDHQLEPLYTIVRALADAIRHNLPVHESPAAARLRVNRPGPNISRIRPARQNRYTGGGLPAFTTGVVESSYDDLLNGTADERALAAALPAAPDGKVKRFLVTAADEQHFVIEGARLTPHHLAVMTDLYRNVSIVLDTPTAEARVLAQQVADIMGLDLVVRTPDGWQTLHPKANPALQQEGTVEFGPGESVFLRTPDNPDGMPIDNLEPHLGRLLGVGGSKAAFAFYDKVVLIALPTIEVSFFKQLNRTLDLLTKPGATEVVAPLRYTTVFDRDAFVADRFPIISRDIWASVPDFGPDATRVLRPTQASLDSLLAIRAFFVANNLVITDLQFGIDPDGRFWAYDVGRIRPLATPPPIVPDGVNLAIFQRATTNPLDIIDAWIAWAADGLGAERAFTPPGPVRGAPPLNENLEPPSYDWTTAIRLNPETLSGKLSSAGRSGAVAGLAEQSGVFRTADQVVKLYPETPETTEIRARVVAEFERVYAAARTGYGPAPHHLVTAEIHGNTYVGFAMEAVDGGFVTALSDDPAVRAEAARWRQAVTLDTVLQLHDYVRRLHALGYYPHDDIQGFVDEHGNFRPIDLAGLEPLPDDPDLRRMAVEDHGLGLEGDLLSDQLLAAAVDNVKRTAGNDTGRARRAVPQPGAGNDTGRARRIGPRPRAHRDQPRGGAGSIYRSDFRGDGRSTPEPDAVHTAAQAAAPQIADAVAAARGEATDVAVSADRITITLQNGQQLILALDVSGDFVDAGPVRWERTAQEAEWARITLSPQARDEVVGRAVAHAVAGVLSAYRGESPAEQTKAGRRAEVGYLVGQLESERSRPHAWNGGSPHHLRKELRLLLRHLNKLDGQFRGMPPLPRGLRRRVGVVLQRNAIRTRLADELMPRLDEIEDRLTDPAAFRPTMLPSELSDTSTTQTPDPAVDRFVHRLFQHFARQPEVGPGESVSRKTVLREQPLLRQFVNWYGADTAAALGRLTANQFAERIAVADQRAVAGAFARLRELLDRREHGQPRQRRTAARQFTELANALGVVAHEDLRAALPHDLAAAVAELKPTLLTRIGRRLDGGVRSLPSLPAQLAFGFVETVPFGAVSAAVLASHGQVGLAAAVLAGTTAAWPVRTVVNRYVEARDERVKSDRRTYRRELDEQSRAPRRAAISNTIHTAYQQLLTTASNTIQQTGEEDSGQVNGQPDDQAGEVGAQAGGHAGSQVSDQRTGPARVHPNPLGEVGGGPRSELAAPEVKAPPLTPAWWTFPVRSAVPVAAGALRMALVVPPLAVGATIGLAAAVVGTARYRYSQHKAARDHARRTVAYEWRSWRQLVDELRSSADHLVRLRALGKELGDPTIDLPDLAIDPPIHHTGRDQELLEIQNLLLAVAPLIHRTANAEVHYQLAAATAAVLESMARLGAIGAVYGIVEAFHTKVNRHALDRRMHDWLELLRTEVQARSDDLADPILTQLDQLLTADPQEELKIPPLPPWSPVVHPDREAMTSRRRYAVGAAAIVGAGVGVAAWMVHRFNLDPLYLDLAAMAGAVQPVSFYAKYLHRRMRIKAELAERDRGAEQRAAVELDRARAATADAAHHVGRLEDALNGKPPRTRPAPPTELGRFIESERDDSNDPELSRLLTRLTELETERQRLLQRYDAKLPTELHELSEVLQAISTTLSQYADAMHKLGRDPHIRLDGPENRPVSASILHHDPLHARNLTTLTWAPGRHHQPSVDAENAALIAAKVQQATNGRYGPFSMAQVQAHTAPGRRLTDIAADLVADAERRRTSSRHSRASAERALAARVDFQRSLTADHARAVPARLIQQERRPLDWPTYAGLQAEALERKRTDLVARAKARTESAVKAAEDPAKAARHTAIAAACTTAAQQADDARHAWQSYRANPTQAALQTARHQDDLYRQRLAETLPPKDVLQTAIISGRLPHLTALTEDLNQALARQGNKFRFTPELLHRTLRAETRRLLSPGGIVLTIGNDPRADVTELTQFELTLDPTELQEVLDHPVYFEEGQLGQLVQGGYNIATTATQAFGANGGLKLATVLSALPDTNPAKAVAQVLSPSVDYAKNVGLSVTGGATEYGLPGAVEVIQDEILRFRAAHPRWSWRMRTSAVGSWSEQHVVATGADQDATTLDLGISHSYTAGTPKDTVTLTSLDLIGQRRTDLPEHVATRADGLSELADRAIAGLRQRLGSLDRIGHDQLRGLLTEDAPGRLAEATRPGGLTRIITNGGRVVAYAQLRTVPRWERATLLGDSSKDHKIERLRVGFSGTSGGQTFSAGDSVSVSAAYGGTATADLHTSSWDAGPGGKAGISLGHDVSVNTGDTAIHPSVQRMHPTVGVKLRLEHRLTVHRVDQSGGFTLTAAGDAVLRMPENDAFRYGLPVPSAALVLEPDGQRRRDADGRPLLRGDPQPTDEVIDLPVWMQSGRRQIRGAGPALVQDFRGADEALAKFLDHLTAAGLIPNGALAGQDPALTASQLANRERVRQQLAGHRLETGYDPAAQEGIVFRLDRHRTGLPPKQHTYRIKLVPYPGDAKLLGLTTGETVVNLDIGSNTTGRSGGWSRSVPWQVKLGFGDKPGTGQAGPAPEIGPSYGQSSFGRFIGWALGNTVNRVSLTESTAPVAVFDVPHTLIVTEVIAGRDSAPIAEVDGSARLSIDSEFCRRDGARPASAIDGPVDPMLLRLATFQAVDIGEPVERLTAVLPELARADSSALHHLSAFLNARNLAARPELLTAPYRTSLMISPPPSGPVQARVQHGLTTGRARLTVTAAVQNLKYVGSGSPVNGEINLTLGSSTITTGTSTGRSIGLGGGSGAVETDGSSYGGSLGGSGSRAWSASRTETQIGGVERLAIRDGEHYQFWGDLVVAARLQAIGAAARTVELSSGAVMLTLPEREALRLYARGEMDLPASKVDSAVQRLVKGELNLPPRTVVALVSRYAGGTHHEQLRTAVRELPGVRTSSDPSLGEMQPAVEKLIAEQTEIRLSEHYTTTMGAALIDDTTLLDSSGEQTDLYREVLAAIGASTPEALDDPVLTAGLRGDLAGLRWHGHVDDLLSPSGFVTEYPTGDGRRVTVRITLRYEGPITIDGVPDEGGKENVFTIVQVYDYREEGRGVTRSTTYNGQLGGALAEDGSGTASVGTDLGTSTTASSTEQNTRMTRALWNPTKRVSRGYQVTVQVDESAPRILTGELTLLVPASVINVEPPSEVTDQAVVLPRGTVVEGTTAPGLFDQVHQRLRRSDMLKKAGAELHRITLENTLSAATRIAAFERIASPEGHTMVQLPVPGHRSRIVTVRVRAELSGMRLISEDDAQLGQIDRQQRITQLTTKSNRALPAARSAGGSLPAAGLQAGVSSGEQASEKVTDTTGNRNETTMNENGQVVTVKVDVAYHLEYARLHVDRNGDAHAGPTDTGVANGTAYLTMFRHEYDALLGRPFTARPARPGAGDSPHTAGSIAPPDPSSAG